MTDDRGLVWYVSYGSNLSAGRFACYLSGGTPPGSRRRYAGCRDTSPVRGSEPVWLPGGIVFAGESTVWGGGVAHYDPSLDGQVAARAHLITLEQFGEVLAQERHLDAVGPELTAELRRLRPGDVLTSGAVRYESVHHLGDRDGHPMLTFTAAATVLNAPSAAYLAVIGAGLLETHPWTVADAAAYLAAAPGAAGTWTADTIADVIPIVTPRPPSV